MSPVYRFTNRYRQGTVPARLALVVIALLFGLLGMHALSVGHSVIPGDADRMSADQMSASQVGAQTSGSGDHLKAAVVSAAAGDAAHAAHASEGGTGNGSGMGDHAMGGMLMLCLAVLGAAATLLLGRVFARRLSWWRPTIEAATATLVAATTRVRSTGPPPVWEFSVIRC